MADDEKIAVALSAAAPLAAEPYKVEMVETELTIELPHGETLADVFEGLDTTAHVPYAYLKDGAGSFAKVNIHAPIDDAWLADPPSRDQRDGEQPDGLYVRVDVGAQTSTGKPVYSEIAWRLAAGGRLPAELGFGPAATLAVAPDGGGVTGVATFGRAAADARRVYRAGDALYFAAGVRDEASRYTITRVTSPASATIVAQRPFAAVAATPGWMSHRRGATTITVPYRTEGGEPVDPDALVFADVLGERLRAAFSGRVEFAVTASRQTAVAATFQVRNLHLRRIVFADFVTVHPVARRYLFFSEHTKTVCEKEKIFVHYAPRHRADPSAEGVLLLQITLQEPQQHAHQIEVRVSHAETVDDVAALQRDFVRLLRLMRDAEPGIVAAYNAYAPARAELAVKTRVDAPHVKKTAQRAHALRAKRPGLFPANWPTLCQAQKQPTLFEGKADVDAYLADRFGEPPADLSAADRARFLEDRAHHAINFPIASHPIPGAAGLATSDWYVCGPPKGRARGKYPFPGLQHNNSKESTAYKDLWGRAFRDKYPLTPCCFISDQYETSKASTLWSRYLRGDRGVWNARRKTGGHVLGSKKLVGAGRSGVLPFNLAEIARLAGHASAPAGGGKKGATAPLFRVGVDSGADSALHCLVKACVRKYAGAATAKARADEVAKAKTEIKGILSSKVFQFSQQETFGHTAAELEHILDVGYVDPRLFIRIFELAFQCNICLFQVDAEHPRGDILLPRHSRAYLARDVDERKKTIILVLQQVADRPYPFQCELIGHHSARPDHSQFVFVNDRFAEQCQSFAAASNTVYHVTPDGRSDIYQPAQRSDFRLAKAPFSCSASLRRK